MGWVLYENYPLDPRPGGSSTLVTLPGEDFPKVDAVALMFSWQDVERREGEYDFTKADHAYDYWRKHGKRIQLRSQHRIAPLVDQPGPAGRQGNPELRARPAARRSKADARSDGIPYVVVDAREPYYLDRLGKFLRAVDAHFADDRPVALIDLRGFGLWGEWHSGYRYASENDRRAALIGVIDCWSAAFPRNWLALSYSYDPDGPASYHAGPTKQYDRAFTKDYAGFVRFSAFDHALTKPNVTLRRDGAGGAVHSNERRLNEEAFATLARAHDVRVRGRLRPVEAGAPGWVEWKINDALSLHPNYVCLLGWQGADALAFCRERDDLIDRGLRTMGYRLVPTRVKYPAEIAAGRPARVEMEWVNRGVGRAMRDYQIKFMLTDAGGQTVATADGGPLGTDKWVKGNTFPIAKPVEFDKVPMGEYILRIAVIGRENGPVIGLPLGGRADDGSYPVGTLHVVHPGR